VKKSFLLLLLPFLTVVGLESADKPSLTRGESFIDVPAMGKGLRLHNLFQSGMVLQRDKEIAVWGWATAGEKVNVSFAGQSADGVAGEDGSWRVTLPPMEANANGQSLTVQGKEEKLQCENILIGDLWVLGGQSNMEFDLAKLVNGRLEIASANFPNIRHITVPQLDGPEHKDDFPRHYKWSSWSNRHFKQGYWETCSPETVPLLSGMGYVFARRIHMAIEVPIGVIDVSRGGTTVETWTPIESLRKIEGQETKELLAQWDQKVADFDPQKDLEDQIQRHHSWVEKMKKQGKEPNRPVPSEFRPGPAMDQNRPGNCFASSISPLKGLKVKGAIFHQGFNNCFSGSKGSKMYYQVFGEMVKAWRHAFGDPQMPFGIISLCTAGNPQDQMSFVGSMMDIGAEIREAQYKTFLDLKEAGDTNIGFASSFDQRRSWYHPQIKIPVGERMAKWALATQYETKLTWEPPAFKELELAGPNLIVHLDAQVGPHNDGPIYGFGIAGEDKKFQMAEAKYFLKGRDSRNRPQYDKARIVLSSPLVPNPIHFRHAWSRNPMTNLKKNGIPLPTMRSDSWTLEDLYEAYTGKKTETGTLERAERRELSKAMRESDMERRLKEAELLLEKHRGESKE